MFDRYDTPGRIAEEMVGYVDCRDIRVIADFAVGRGSLLGAAVRRWSSVEVIGVDIDASVVGKLRREFPNWRLGRVDFLSGASRGGCRALRGAKGVIDLILLNPPFSCRGASRRRVKIFGQEVRCSTALAFVLEAAKYVRYEGCIVAILPAGVFDNEKDENAWAVLRRHFEVRECREYGRDAFVGCFVRTVIVQLTRVDSLGHSANLSWRQMRRSGLEMIEAGVVRGGQQMHRASFSSNGNGVRLVHTTDLREGKVARRLRNVEGFGWAVRGPGVLIPRVGEPHRDKIALLGIEDCVVLSDCVIGILCSTHRDALDVQKRLISAWPRVAQRYSGTCARFVTLSALRVLLEELGVRAKDGEGRKLWIGESTYMRAGEVVLGCLTNVAGGIAAAAL